MIFDVLEEKLNHFDIKKDELRHLASTTTPLFVYSKKYLKNRAELLMNLRFPYGFLPRYAVKANNHPEIIKLFNTCGLSFDASSGYEAEELINLGVPGEKISLSSQEPAHNLSLLLNNNVKFVATSLYQLRLFIACKDHQSSVGLRVNPGLGAGHNNRTMTGGANSSFGLWAAYVDDAISMAHSANVKIDRLHVHIGSGADPKVWAKVLEVAFDLIEKMPDVTSIDIGGGFKIHRFGDEHETNIEAVADVFSEGLANFAAKTGRKLRIEIEPGTWLVGHGGVLIASIVDIVDTGDDGHTFLRLNTGMNDILRPGMYGAQHEMAVLTDSEQRRTYVVVGHNCETGDILTPAPSDPEGIDPRELNEAKIGDALVIYDVGAYCRSMAAHGYNSYPNAKEIII